jgi:predicted MFS family arabinose efflux permease
MSVLAVGAPAGMILGFLVAGVVSDAFGWRAALIVVGAPGLILAGVMYARLREPDRGGADGDHDDSGSGFSIWQSTRFMFGTPAIRHLLIAATISGMMSYGLSTWIPAFFVRSHGLSQSEVGLLMALVFGLLGAAGTLTGGKLFDRLSVGGFERGVWMIALVQVAVIPLLILAYQASSLVLAVGFFLMPAFVGSIFLGPTLALVQTLSPVPMRAMAAAIKMLCLNLVGLSLGPLIIGSLSDALKGSYGEASLSMALSIVSILSVWSALHFWLCGRAMRRVGTELT